MEEGFREFTEKILKYFLEFLETDFKRQQAPRRKVSLRNDAGFRTGINLTKKYPTLYKAVWDSLARSTEGSICLRVPRSRYKAPIEPIIKDLLRKCVQKISRDVFQEVRDHTRRVATEARAKVVGEPEAYIEMVLAGFAEKVGELVVSPLLARLEEIFQKQSYSAIESAYETEGDLIQAIAAQVHEHLPRALNTFIVTGEFGEADEVLQTFFEEAETKERINAVFEDLATADAFSEVRDIVQYLHSGMELQFYLYACDVRFEQTTYPLFYLPGAVKYREETTEYQIELEPHLYVNRRAIDYILGHQSTAAARLAIAPIDRRIIYLREGEQPVDVMQGILNRLVPVFDLPQPLTLGKGEFQSQASTTLKASTKAYFAIFDKADEALLNDYEELIVAIQQNQQEANELFKDILRGVLFEEPASAQPEVDKAWLDTPIPERLVAKSPIPVNEEQQKILRALDNDKCRFIAVEGPPGTGKSHTITAISFNCILNGRSVLILSDKQEALDVVEDKLTQTLTSVRYVNEGEDFPNPILRLGKSGTFPQLIKQAALAKIRGFTNAYEARRSELDSEKEKVCRTLRENIDKTAKILSSIELSDIEKILQLEAEIGRQVHGYEEILKRQVQAATTSVLVEVIQALEATPAALLIMDPLFTSGSMTDLLAMLQVYSAADQITLTPVLKTAMGLFSSLDVEQHGRLIQFIAEYQSLRMPLFGYLFRGKKLRELNARLGNELPCINPVDVRLRIEELKQVVEVSGEIRDKLQELRLPGTLCGDVYRLLRSIPREQFTGASTLRRLIEAFAAAFGPEALEPLRVGSQELGLVSDVLTFMLKAAQYSVKFWSVRHRMESLPEFDYVGEKTQLERLYTVDMANRIDHCFLDFVTNNKAKTAAVASLIKSKQQFPHEEFDGLKRAFPCIIAGIREFAEYVPLHKEIFDIVVIDEASQVSVAQAFPALLRAGKVIVFGDHNQFSNVKSMHASNATNDAYLRQIDQSFRARVSANASTLMRLQQFDVKKSILEFFELIANYSTMLRKHFRGYQELISFSSKHFYGGQLQAIKLRGKPLEEIIKFSQVKSDGANSLRRNTNKAEADFILTELRRLVDEDVGMIVGVITPFREQQQFLSRTLLADSYADQFERLLRLKVMTFDSCQGEERDIVFYSMVATENSDLLNYIFPVDLASVATEEGGSLKKQRLNVGFSRSKECMHFVISKPVEKFRGSIGRALTHYKKLLEERRVPTPEETDPNSPMEKKVLDWIQKTPFFQRHQEDLELIAQFPIGDYLRQLDPLYQHPSYRCDFLLRYYGKGTVNIIIEYDGFLDHFREHGKVHQGNYDRYYKPEDIERQMIIESYGYKFLRLNRFNLGVDPVQTISQRLSTFIKEAERDKAPQSAERLRGDAENLANGDAKTCSRCKHIKPLEKYFDPSLKGGQGGYGRVCMDCKRKDKPSHQGRRFRRWRY